MTEEEAIERFRNTHPAVVGGYFWLNGKKIVVDIKEEAND